MSADPVAALVERLAIEEVLYRYGSTIDVKDYAGLRKLIADDAVITFGTREPLGGGDAAVAFIRGVGDGVIDAHHHLTVFHVDVDGDSARALTYVTAHQIFRAAPDRAHQLVGRYHDRLARVGGRWLISEKRLEIVCRAVVTTAT